ncbi:uncharacterized protein LOC110091792 [Dendrobium catenatum]|uniref:uncharacterized protein LOC110091792 n=1 Tax=Dendrobium catenatum TaxID=906689 RepID=UPI0009F3F825|nr:uncharacterized protein LOC110091792 [Dendrobium catenatum]
MLSFMRECDFHDTKFIGPNYTWCNNKTGKARILERLDRCLLNCITLNHLKVPVVNHLARIASDHCPIMLRISSPSVYHNYILRFEDTWLSYPASHSVVWFAWNKPAKGNAYSILNLKFRRSLKALFFWSKAKHKDLSDLKNKLKKEILELQDEESKSSVFSVQNTDLLRTKVRELNATLGRLCTWWKQRSKSKWIKEGDSNSKYFHASASARRNFKWINQLKNNDGSIIYYQEEITEAFSNFSKTNGVADHALWTIGLCVLMSLMKLILSGWTEILQKKNWKL